MNKIVNWYDKNKKIVQIICLVIAFCLLFFALYTKEYRSDDLIYCMKWKSDEPLSSINDIIDFQIHHYFEWGGRTVAHSIAQLLFLIGKPISSLLITIAFFLLAYMIVKIATGKFSIFLYSIVLGCLYYLNPAFEKTVLWYTGSANYLWTTLIMLVAIYPAVKIFRKESLSAKDYLLLPFCFLAGWGNENTSPTLLLFLLFLLVSEIKRHEKVQIWLVISIVLWALGCALLILAPGNSVRSSEFSSGLMAIAYRGHGQVNSWLNWLLPTNVILYITYVLKKKVITKKENKLNIGVIFCILGYISMLVMIASPTYPVRATFGSLVFLLIAIMTNISSIYQYYEKELDLIALMLIVGICGCMLSTGLLAFVRGLGTYIPGE